MDSSKLAQYSNALQDLRVELEAELARSKSEAAPVEVNGTMGRVSRGDAMQAQQVALEAKRQREQRLVRIQTALGRIEQGTYGICPRCRNAISDARLEAFPDSVLCVTCAS